MNESTQQPQTLQVVSCENSFHKRVSGLEQFIPWAPARETYMVARTWMNDKTRTCFPSVRMIADRARISVRTVQRHLTYLAVELGVLVITKRRKSCRSNLTSIYTFPLLNEEFLRRRVSPGGCQNVTVKQIPEIKEQPTTARVAREEYKPDRETYIPWRDRPHVGRCRMRFTQAFVQPNVVNPKPDSELTEQEKAEIDAIRKRLGEPPLYGLGGSL